MSGGILLGRPNTWKQKQSSNQNEAWRICWLVLFICKLPDMTGSGSSTASVNINPKYHYKEACQIWQGYCVWYIISYLGMKSWDLHVWDRASTITHVDRVEKSNPWYNKIWFCLNVTNWSSQICFSVIFIHFVMIQNIWEEKKCTYSHFFQSPVTASAYFWSALKAC